VRSETYIRRGLAVFREFVSGCHCDHLRLGIRLSVLPIGFSRPVWLNQRKPCRTVSLMNSWRAAFARTDDRVGTTGLCPKRPLDRCACRDDKGRRAMFHRSRCDRSAPGKTLPRLVQLRWPLPYPSRHPSRRHQIPRVLKLPAKHTLIQRPAQDRLTCALQLGEREFSACHVSSTFYLYSADRRAHPRQPPPGKGHDPHSHGYEARGQIINHCVLRRTD
jgi:hypothetical protein